MDVRKLVSFGNSSYVISLPKAWIVKNGLKKGDLIGIDERPYELIISAKENSKKKPVETLISCEGKGLSELKTEIIAAYVNNSGVITISGSNVKNVSSTLKQVIHGLVGMEVIDETSSKIVVKDLLDISEVSTDNIVRRMDILIKSMLEDSLLPDSIESIYERDNEVNRLALLALRIFRAATDNPSMLKIFNTTYWDVFISRQVTVQLEHIGDYIKRMTRLLKNNRNGELKKIYIELSARYRESMKLYYGKNKQASYRMETDTKRFMQLCDKIIEKSRDVATTRVCENLKHMTKAIMYILRNVMEHQ
ncbi:phosphate uptake regulator PhoU [Candidatus Woesearchaeota archaeon]|nr:phosphate uptake regulator PhoU [Candidatus Woesearchaeota archaeon]